MQSPLVRWLAVGIALICAPLAGAADQASASSAGKAASAGQEEVRYVPLQPSFVTNFGEGASGRLSYIKADVSLRVSGQDAAAATRYHLPALRNTLVLLFSSQDHASIASGDGRESLRAEALAQIRAILEAQEGEPYVEDVLFTNFFVQR